MNWLDFVIIGSVGVVAIMGMRMGGIHIAVAGAGALAGLALASRVQGRAEPFFSKFIGSENGAELAAFVAVFAVVLVSSLFLGMVVRALLQRLMLGWTDKLAGMGVAAAVVLVAGSGLLSTVQSYPVLGLEVTIADSVLGAFLADNFDTVVRGMRFVPSDLGV